MSDVSQGAGWWIASDGKWYPPHLHPSASSVLTRPTYPAGYGPTPWSPSAPQHPGPTIAIDSVLNLNLAPWWKRFVAILVDFAVLAVPYLIAIIAIGSISSHSDTSTSTSSPVPVAAIIAGVIFFFVLLQTPLMLYYGIMNGSKRGQTLGKMAMGIAVRDARTGGPIGFWRGIGRFAISFVFDVLLLIPYLIDNLSPLWSSRRQACHDRVVRSVVIDLRP
jgi:uncharacterized RDD family membrane protein YckC